MEIPMRFQITLNMPSRAQSLVHQILAESDVNSFEEFVEICNNNQFILIDEIYKDGIATKNVGPLAINTDHIGKIKPYIP